MNEKWIVELSEIDSEIWGSDIECSTREDAIREGMECAKRDVLTNEIKKVRRDLRIKERIKKLTIQAMKDKNVVIRDMFRLIQSEIAKREKELKRDLTDEEVYSVLNKEKKQLIETLGFYDKDNVVREMGKDLNNDEIKDTLLSEDNKVVQKFNIFNQGDMFKTINSILEITHKIATIESLLPQLLSEEEVRARIDEIFEHSTFINMGGAMQAILSTSLAKEADKAMISKIVKEKFSSK